VTGGSGTLAEQRRQLVVEAALEAGYRLRLRCPSPAGEIEEHLVRPTMFMEPGGLRDGSDVQVLVARDALDGKELRVRMPDIVSVSVDIGQLPVDRITLNGFTLGDAVRHPHFGFGVVQAIRPSPSGNVVQLRFFGGATRSLVLERAELERVDAED